MSLNRPDMQSNLKPDETKPRRPIFRAEAIRRYEQRREQAILPRFIVPRTFLILWLLIGLLVSSGVIAWLTPVPVYASGPALVVKTDNLVPGLSDQVVLVAFLPPENLSHLRVGQALFLQLTPEGERINRPLVAVEPEIVSPESAQQRFGLSVGMMHLVNQPAAIVIARLEPIPTDLPATTYLGSTYQVDVQIGSHRVVSLVPLLGQFFGSNE